MKKTGEWIVRNASDLLFVVCLLGSAVGFSFYSLPLLLIIPCSSVCLLMVAVWVWARVVEMRTKGKDDA